MSGNPGTDACHPLTAGFQAEDYNDRLGRDQVIHRVIPFGDSPFNPNHAEHEQEVTVEPGTRLHIHGVSFVSYREMPHPNPEAAAQGYTQRSSLRPALPS